MSNIKLFEEKKVRSHYDTEIETWYFSVIDVIEILTGSTIPKRYWADLKKKLKTNTIFLSCLDSVYLKKKIIFQYHFHLHDNKVY